MLYGHRRKDNITCLWKYKLLYLKCCNGCVMGERLRKTDRRLWLTPHGDIFRVSQELLGFTLYLQIYLTHVEIHISGPSSLCFSTRGWPPKMMHFVYLADRFSPDWLPDSLGSKNFHIIYFPDAHTFYPLAQFTWFISAVFCLHRCISCFEITN